MVFFVVDSSYRRPRSFPVTVTRAFSGHSRPLSSTFETRPSPRGQPQRPDSRRDRTSGDPCSSRPSPKASRQPSTKPAFQGRQNPWDQDHHHQPRNQCCWEKAKAPARGRHRPLRSMDVRRAQACQALGPRSPSATTLSTTTGTTILTLTWAQLTSTSATAILAGSHYQPCAPPQLKDDRGRCKGPPPDCRRIVIRLWYGIKGRSDAAGQRAQVKSAWSTCTRISP